MKTYVNARKKTLRVYFFPTYSPELNIVEQHWKVGKLAIANRALRSIPTTQYHVKKTLTKKELMPKMFEYLIN